jgi:hypothetical protein
MSSGRVLVSGASGMVGRALLAQLRTPSAANGFRPQVLTLVRRAPRDASEVWWQPTEGQIDLRALEGIDAVVHLAGENIGSGEGPLAPLGRWSDRKKHAIVESRRRGTLLLARSLAALKRKPRVLVSASGVGFYGDAGDAALTEASPKGRGFLADVADVWEASTAPAEEAGVRVARLRFGVVLSRGGGVVEKLYWPFFFGGGGPVGSGRQWVSWVALPDAVRAIQFAIAHESVRGAVNACSPEPARNADFMRALGRAMGRPSLVPLPEAAVRLVFGEMGEETLLASQRVLPRKLQEASFKWLHPDIDAGVRAALRG